LIGKFLLGLLLFQGVGGHGGFGGKAGVGGGVSAPAGITRVNQGVWGQQTITGEMVTGSLAWTVGTGHFLVAQVAYNSATLASVVANAGSTPYTMTLAACETSDSAHVADCIYYLDNTAAITSVTTNWTSSNGSAASLAVAEYSGLSTTAAIVNTTVVSNSGYVPSTTWTVGPYTATAGDLLITASANSGTPGGTFSASSPWTVVTSSGGGNPNIVLQEDLAVTAGSYTGTGTWSLGANYQVYSNLIVGFK
jgi:hypothetical protein